MQRVEPVEIAESDRFGVEPDAESFAPSSVCREAVDPQPGGFITEGQLGGAVPQPQPTDFVPEQVGRELSADEEALQADRPGDTVRAAVVDEVQAFADGDAFDVDRERVVVGGVALLSGGVGVVDLPVGGAVGRYIGVEVGGLEGDAPDVGLSGGEFPGVERDGEPADSGQGVGFGGQGASHGVGQPVEGVADDFGLVQFQGDVGKVAEEGDADGVEPYLGVEVAVAEPGDEGCQPFRGEEQGGGADGEAEEQHETDEGDEYEFFDCLPFHTDKDTKTWRQVGRVAYPGPGFRARYGEWSFRAIGSLNTKVGLLQKRKPTFAF